MKIIDLKTALIGNNITFRVVTDKGIDGYAQVENLSPDAPRPDVRALVPYYRQLILGCDPTNVADVMRRIRRVGAFKPWGKVVSTIEIALWDIAGKEAGLPVYKLLGGKVRDQVRVYSTRYALKDMPHSIERTVEDRAENILALHEEAGFTIVKTAVAWHANMKGFFDPGVEPGESLKCQYAYNTYPLDPPAIITNTGSWLTNRAMDNMVNYVGKLTELVGDKVGLAFDCGPGWIPSDALRFAREVEPFKVMWLEDTIAGDYSPQTMAHVYRDITQNTTTNIHTGEQIYLRENFRELIENHAVNVIGPDPADVGGLAELKWIAEYADLHGIQIAPHGVFDGVFGMAALTHVCSTLPQNYIAYEYPQANPEWWYDIVDGLPDPLLEKGHVKVWDRPGLGVEFRIGQARKYLRPEDKEFFD